MRDYAKVAPTFWTRGSGKALRGHPFAQVVALFLMTCPEGTMSGIFPIAIPTIAHQTGITVAAVRVALALISEKGIAHYDDEAELAYLVRGVVYQAGPSLDPKDKRATGLRRELASLGRHAFVGDFFARYGTSHGVGACPFANDFAPFAFVATEAPSKPLSSPFDASSSSSSSSSSSRNDSSTARALDPTERSGAPEAPDGQDEPTAPDARETTTPGQALAPLAVSETPGAGGAGATPGPAKGPPGPSACDVGAVLEHWRATLYPAANPAPKLTESRRRRVRSRMAEGFTREQLQQAITGAFSDDWLMGRDPGSRHGGYRDVETVLRDAAQVERLMRLAEPAAVAVSVLAPVAPMPRLSDEQRRANLIALGSLMSSVNGKMRVN